MNKDLCQNCGAPNPPWTERFAGAPSLLKCGACGSFSWFGQLEEKPEEIYGKDYFEADEYVGYEAHSDVHRLNFRRKYRIVEKLSAERPRIFEVGCAYGFFLEQAKRQGAPYVYGVDVSPDIVAAAQARAGKESAGVTGSLPNAPVNCVVAWDVWEHLPNPFEMFSEFRSLLPSGGLLALTTVDSSAAVARMRKQKWRQIHPPTHLHYPTKKGLRAGLEKLGFEVVYHRPFGYYRALETYTKAFGIPVPAKKLAQAPVYLNLYDVQFIVGRKR